MSFYTIGENWVWFLIAAVLGAILGWFLRGGVDRDAGGAQPAVAAKPAAPGTAAEARRQVAAIAARTAKGAEAPYDDLELVHGIGPKIEKLLYSMGITSFRQVARFERDDIAIVSAALEVFPDRIERDDWMASAREQHRRQYGDDPLA